ncbi:DUF3775 domain-containing protein [Telmatospirillum sp. J64-1]|uniref:DUF3775 domain-containing protein n=1 Tax=Telmatospirillum sp. J64-1 TaxID=2502183 RepID=UPI00115DAF89|nr:DUF3775 domain-containing protein [Telmatospirillum sp. J64-1]
MADLNITVDKVCEIIQHAQELGGKAQPIDDDSPVGGSGDDSPLSPMQEYSGDPTYQILVDLIEELPPDEQADLLAMLWVGRGDFDVTEFEDAQSRANDEVGEGIAPQRIIDHPLLAEYLISSLQDLGYECPEDRVEDGAAGPGGAPSGGML